VAPLIRDFPEGAFSSDLVARLPAELGGIPSIATSDEVLHRV
jgi:hypothetical protein